MANPEIVLDGDTSPFRRALREAGSDLQKFGKDGEGAFGKMSSPLGQLAGKFSLIVAGIAAFVSIGQKALNITEEWTESSIDLANALGISATAAGNLKAALASEGIESSEFMAAAQKLSANMKESEASINSMGLATRDAAGNMRPLATVTVEAIELVGKYKAGTDRAIAANELFGKGFQISGDLAKTSTALIAEATAEQERLGSQVSQQSVAAFNEFDQTMKSVNATIRAFWTTIGTELMPAVSDLGNWFSAIGPSAILVIKGALGGLRSFFHLLTTGVVVLWETMNAMVVTIAEPIRALVASLAKAMTGDFAGAGDEIKGVGKVITNAWGSAFDEMAAKAQKTNDRIAAIFSEGTPTVAVGVTGKDADDLVKKPKAAKEKKEKSEVEKTAMPEYEGKLDSLRLAASEENALRALSKAEELSYWNSVLMQADVAAKDRVAIERKVTDLTLAVRRDAVMQGLAINAEEVRRSEALALGRVDVEQAAVQAALAGEQITKAEALAMEEAFEARRYEIRLAALEASIRLAELDPNTSPMELSKLHGDIEQLELQHNVRMSQIGGEMNAAQLEAAKESGKVWEDLGQKMSGLWDKGMQAMMNGTLRWRNAVKAVGAELTRWFVVNVVGAQVKEYIAGQARMLMAKIMGTTAEVATQTTASTTIAATKTSEATIVGTANAVEAGSGAASAMSGIPYVGPILALAAMAAIFAAVMGMTGKVKSAEGGYDIPSGVNPMTQLHEDEMVLPKEYANTIRGLAAGGGSDGAGGGNSVNVYPRGRMTRQDARDSARHIADALNDLHKGGWSPK